MIKNVLTAVGAVLMSIGLQAQNYGCATDEYINVLLGDEASRDAYLEQLADFDAIAAQRLGSREDAEYVIPVVVHVIYSDCEGNISKSQIEDGLRVLNEDFRRTNADTSITREVFQDHAVDVGIEFRLANLDPSGDPTDGINRIQAGIATNASNNVKSLAYWPSDEYMNIWVVESIQNFTGTSGIILGYAQFPGSGSWNTYGIVIRNDAFGTIGTSNADGRTLTHEIGHCLNLLHTFQDGCGSGCSFTGDRVCDTPPAAGATYNCSFNTNSCGNDGGSGSPYNSGTPDQIENYMSYNSCQNMFSAGQKNRMIAALNTYNPLEELVSEENLIATGVNGLVEADFITSTDIICNTEQVTFSDNSSYAGVATSWKFGGEARPAESTESNPSVQFPYEGYHTVTYTASDSGQSATTTRSVFVVSEEGQFAPYSDDLEEANSISNSNWYSIDPDDDEHEWKLTTEASYSGDKSIKMDNYDKCGSTRDELVTRSFDFSPYSSVNIRFAQAYARAVGPNQNFLRMYASANCGETWGIVWAQSGTALQTVSQAISGPFVPEANQWQDRSIDLIQSAYMKEGVLLKFAFEGLGGNNLYIDDFEISGQYSGDLLLRRPENGNRGMAKDVLLDWKSAGIVDSYEYELDTKSDFSSGNVITGTTDFINTNPNNEDTEVLIEDLELNTTYYWRVRYIQDGNPSEWSDTWNFAVDDTGLGTERIKAESNIKVYPNPTNGLVNVESDLPIESAEILDLTGRNVYNYNGLGETFMTMQPQLPNGLYMIKFVLQNGNIETKSLIVQ